MSRFKSLSLNRYLFKIKGIGIYLRLISDHVVQGICFLFKKKITFYSVLIILIKSSFSFTQNILPNGDFENYTSLPSALGQWGNCIHWENANGQGSPDYFHVLGSFSAALPNTIFATLMPFSGDAIMGFAAMGLSGNNYREYPSIQLSSAMEIGGTYNVSFHITNGESDHNFGYSCDRLGVCFSTGYLTQLNSSPIAGTPQWEMAGQLWSTSWLAVDFNFVADSSYNQLTIGNFYNDASTSYTSQVEGETSEGVYYFIDNVSVVRDPTVSINHYLPDNSFTVSPNPSTGDITIRLKERATGTISIRNSVGQLFISESINEQIHKIEFNAPSGIYFIQLESNGDVFNEILVKK